MKAIAISILIALALIGGVLVLGKNSSEQDSVPVNNVKVIDGTQYIDLTAKGGYSPRKSTAKAGMPTVLRVNTKGTFDCSSSIRIPSMNISRNLSQTGVEEITLGSPSAGVLKGTCGMGMYPFEIDFQN